MVINQELLHAWFKAREIDAANLTNTQTQLFKKQHLKEYNLLNAFYHLRSSLTEDLKVMSLIGDIQWFTLTFDNKRDKSKIESKRKSATRFLNDLFITYEMVEEFGEDNGRYHIHGFGCYRIGKGFNDFIKWPCRNKIETLTEDKKKKKIKYLTNYAVKDLPRRRRSKSLVKLVNYYKSKKKLSISFPECFACKFSIEVCKIHFLGLR